MTRKTQGLEDKNILRFDILQRIQHIIFLISFTMLGFTGLPQKFLLSPISLGLFKFFGGIENARSSIILLRS